MYDDITIYAALEVVDEVDSVLSHALAQDAPWLSVQAPDCIGTELFPCEFLRSSSPLSTSSGFGSNKTSHEVDKGRHGFVVPNRQRV